MGLIQTLLDGADDADAPVAPASSAAPATPAAEAAPSATVDAAPSEAKVAFELDAAAAAAAASKFASKIRGELEKTASEGGGEGVELAKTLAKCAHYIEELLDERKAHEKYARTLLDEAAEAAGLRKYREAVKLACELVAAGRIEPPDDGDMHKLAEDLAREDLRVVKKAAEFAGVARLGSLGHAEKQNGSTEDGARLRDDDRSFLDAHAFLLGR